jgi:hypothetical protein
MSKECHRLSQALHSMARYITLEEVKMAARSLLQCAANTLNVRELFEKRCTSVPVDQHRQSTHRCSSALMCWIRTIRVRHAYLTIMRLTLNWNGPIRVRCFWSSRKHECRILIDKDFFADANDFSVETIAVGRNFYYQKKAALEISYQANQIISLITAALNIHLNLGQSILFDTPAMFISLEKRAVQSLGNLFRMQPEHGHIRLPSQLHLFLNAHEIISVRVCFVVSVCNRYTLVSFSL